MLCEKFKGIDGLSKRDTAGTKEKVERRRWQREDVVNVFIRLLSNKQNMKIKCYQESYRIYIKTSEEQEHAVLVI